MDYDVAAVAGASAELCAALAGFSIVAINIVIDRPTLRENPDLPALIRIAYLSFFGLIITAILQGIRSGQSNIGAVTWSLTIWANFAMVSAMLMLFYALFLLTAVNLAQSDNEHLYDRLFNVAFLAMVFWQLGSMAGFWKSIGLLDNFVWSAGIVFLISLGLCFLPHIRWLEVRINDAQAFWVYLAVIFLPCVLFITAWLLPEILSRDLQILLQVPLFPMLWALVLLLKHERMNHLKA